MVDTQGLNVPLIDHVAQLSFQCFMPFLEHLPKLGSAFLNALVELVDEGVHSLHVSLECHDAVENILLFGHRLDFPLAFAGGHGALLDRKVKAERLHEWKGRMVNI